MLSVLIATYAVDAQLQTRINLYLQERVRVDHMTEAGIAIAEGILLDYQNVDTDSDVSWEERAGKVEELLTVYQNATCVITSRLHCALPCLALGISSFVMVSTESVLSVSFTSSLQRFGGDLAVGAMTVLTSINQLVTMPLMGICQGGQPLIGYNYGAKKLDRVRTAFFLQFSVCVAYALGFWLLIQFCPRLLASIFTNDTALVDYTAWALRIFLAGGFSIGFQISCQQTFVALGQAKISLFMACLRKLILLIPLIFLLPCFLDNQVLAVFLAEPVSDILAAAVTTGTFFTFFQRLSREN